MNKIQEKFNKSVKSTMMLFTPWKWSKEDKREFKLLLLITILMLLVGFFAGRNYECNKTGGHLMSYVNDSFYKKYINPECIFVDEPSFDLGENTPTWKPIE